MSFHFFLSATNSLHLLTPSTWRSLSTSSFHPLIGYITLKEFTYISNVYTYHHSSVNTQHVTNGAVVASTSQVAAPAISLLLSVRVLLLAGISKFSYKFSWKYFNFFFWKLKEEDTQQQNIHHTHTYHTHHTTHHTHTTHTHTHHTPHTPHTHTHTHRFDTCQRRKFLILYTDVYRHRALCLLSFSIKRILWYLGQYRIPLFYMTRCSLGKYYHHFGRHYHLHIQCTVHYFPFSVNCTVSILRAEHSVHFYQNMTWHQRTKYFSTCL